MAGAVTYDQAAALLNAWLLKDKQIRRQSPVTADGRNRGLGNEVVGGEGQSIRKLRDWMSPREPFGNRRPRASALPSDMNLCFLRRPARRA
jgi:hypothetical protein